MRICVHRSSNRPKRKQKWARTVVHQSLVVKPSNARCPYHSWLFAAVYFGSRDGHFKFQGTNSPQSCSVMPLAQTPSPSLPAQLTVGHNDGREDFCFDPIPRLQIRTSFPSSFSSLLMESWKARSQSEPVHPPRPYICILKLTLDFPSHTHCSFIPPPFPFLAIASILVFKQRLVSISCVYAEVGFLRSEC